MELEAMFVVFARYPRPTPDEFCTFCWSEAELVALQSAELRSLDLALSRKLLWETSDHWGSSQAYRHYLPRMFEVMSARFGIPDLYPAHVFETMTALGFATWPADEQAAVRDVIEAMTNVLSSIPGLAGEEPRMEWHAAARALWR